MRKLGIKLCGDDLYIDTDDDDDRDRAKKILKALVKESLYRPMFKLEPETVELAGMKFVLPEPPVVVLNEMWWPFADQLNLWESKWPIYVKAKKIDA